MTEAKRILGDSITYCKDIYETINQADALLLITEWKEFRMPNWDIIKKLMNNVVIFDGRNIYDANEMKKLGFYYEGIGF